MTGRDSEREGWQWFQNAPRRPWKFRLENRDLCDASNEGRHPIFIGCRGFAFPTIRLEAGLFPQSLMFGSRFLCIDDEKIGELFCGQGARG